MNVSQRRISSQVDVSHLDVPYVADPLALFSQLTQHGERHHAQLLESAEIDSKANTKSLLLIDAALRIVCNGQQVELEALSANGENVLALLQDSLAAIDQQRQKNVLTLTFVKPAVGLDEEQRLKAHSPLHTLRQLLTQLQGPVDEPMAIFLGGLFAYDLIATFEPLPEVTTSATPCPDALFYLAETLLIVDHSQQTSRLLGTVFPGVHQDVALRQRQLRMQQLAQQCQHPIAPLAVNPVTAVDNEVYCDVSDAQYCEQVTKLKGNIQRGDIFQVVPSRTFNIACPDPLLAYQQLKQTNPSPYMFYLVDRDFSLFGASPESALKYEQDSGQIEICPIAGTRKRGRNADGSIDLDLDSRIELELRQDEKELAEHLMLVDLARNDIARIAEPGTRHVAGLLKVDRYSHVMHLVSRVVGQLRHDLDALHAYQACMNMGTLTGAPKIRAAQLIREAEGKRRGAYGGAVGYLNGHGDMDTCIVIRSAVVSQGQAYIQAGAGVVYDSDPQSEADETRNKAQAVLSAIRQANSQQQEADHE